MKIFHPENRTRSEHNKRVYARYELWYTIVDVGAALSFLIGSALFFSEATKAAATWLFLIGSILFMLKPTIRLARESAYFHEGKIEPLARRVEDP